MSIFFVTLCLSVVHNYFNNPTKLFSDLYLAKLYKRLRKWWREVYII